MAGHIDTARVGVSGYSMGGMTTDALLTAFPDSRIKAAVAMSSIRMGNPSGAVRADVLFIHGDQDPLTSYASARQSYEEMSPSKAFLTFVGGNHSSYFSDSRAIRTYVDWMRWSLYGDTAARDRLTTDATSSATRWEFVPGSTQPPPTSAYYHLVAQHSSKVAEINAAATTAGGARISQYLYSGNPNLRFTRRAA